MKNIIFLTLFAFSLNTQASSPQARTPVPDIMKFLGFGCEIVLVNDPTAFPGDGYEDFLPYLSRTHKGFTGIRLSQGDPRYTDDETMPGNGGRYEDEEDDYEGGSPSGYTDPGSSWGSYGPDSTYERGGPYSFMNNVADAPDDGSGFITDLISTQRVGDDWDWIPRNHATDNAIGENNTKPH